MSGFPVPSDTLVQYVSGLVTDGTSAAANKTTLDAAIAAAADGTTLLLPAGNVAFNALAGITKSITFSGVGWVCTNFGALFGDAGWAIGSGTPTVGTVLRPANTTGVSINFTGSASKALNFNNLAIIGPGSGTSTLVSTGGGSAFPNMMRWSHVLLANAATNLDWQGGLDSVCDHVISAASGLFGLKISQANDTQWVGSKSLGHTGIGVQISGTTGARLYGLLLQAGAAGSTGCKITGASGGNLIDGAYCENVNGTWAIDVDSGSGNEIVGLHLGQPGDAVRVNAGATIIRNPQSVQAITLTAASTNTILDGTGWAVTDLSGGSVIYTAGGVPKLAVGGQVSLDLVARSTTVVGSWVGAMGSFVYMQYNSTAAVNDAITFQGFFASAGTFNLDVLAEKFNDGGIVTVQVDGVSIGTFDLYNSTGTASRNLITGFTVGQGWHAIKFISLAKNASSSAFTMRLHRATFTRTA